MHCTLRDPLGAGLPRPPRGEPTVASSSSRPHDHDHGWRRWLRQDDLEHRYLAALARDLLPPRGSLTTCSFQQTSSIDRRSHHALWPGTDTRELHADTCVGFECADSPEACHHPRRRRRLVCRRVFTTTRRAQPCRGSTDHVRPRGKIWLEQRRVLQAPRAVWAFTRGGLFRRPLAATSRPSFVQHAGTARGHYERAQGRGQDFPRRGFGVRVPTGHALHRPDAHRYSYNHAGAWRQGPHGATMAGPQEHRSQC